jgi:hypothetical protein
MKQLQSYRIIELLIEYNPELFNFHHSQKSIIQ